jgi:hypothetical protein
MTVYDMTPRWLVVGLLALTPLLLIPAVQAQQSPVPASKQAPPPDDLEPGVNTSSMPAPGNGSAGVSSSPTTAAPASAPGDTTSAPAPKDSKSTPESNSGAVKSAKGAPRPTNAPAASATTNSAPKGGKAEDHLQLDTTQITGNQELPKVLYIVPWKKSDLGDLLGKPANSLLDEVLQPVDRDVFKRENRYYDALKPDAAGTGTSAGGAAGAGNSGSGDKR